MAGAGSFFHACKDFTISGGQFNEVKGNYNQYHNNYTYASSDSHDHNWNAYNAANSHNFGPGSRSPYTEPAYRRNQDGPIRSQSHPTSFSEQNPRPSAPRQATVPALPDPRVRSQEEEVSAQLRGPYRSTGYASPLHSARPAPPLQGPFAPPMSSAPAPMARPNSSSHQLPHDTGDAMRRSGSLDNARSAQGSSPWAPRTAHPSFGQRPQIAVARKK